MSLRLRFIVHVLPRSDVDVMRLTIPGFAHASIDARLAQVARREDSHVPEVKVHSDPVFSRRHQPNPTEKINDVLIFYSNYRGGPVDHTSSGSASGGRVVAARGRQSPFHLKSRYLFDVARCRKWFDLVLQAGRPARRAACQSDVRLT